MIALVFVKAKYFNEEQQKAQKRKAAREKNSTWKRQRRETSADANQNRGVDEDKRMNVDETEYQEESEAEEIQDDEGKTVIDTSNDAKVEAAFNKITPSKKQLLVRWQLYYETARIRAASVKGSTRKKKMVELPIELDDMINAHEYSLNCQCVPIKLYFGSNLPCESVHQNISLYGNSLMLS